MSAAHLDTCFEIVSDGARRAIIRQLRRETVEETTVADLIDQLLQKDGAWPTDAPPNRDRIAILLYHNHLPRLDDHGVVEFDPERRTVAYHPNERIEAVLDALPEDAAQTTV
ncbi:MAG: ArsR family transcriptional regulator [Halorubrum sp.]|uniref:DUF7344 domain-containing protein n=1 Tax=Halorubrum sp. TaxID=1879286 RepID=UPI003970D49E